MTSDSTIMERVHEIDKQVGNHEVRIANLDSWVGDIHKTLKSLESRVWVGTGMLIGAQVVIQFAFQLWGKK